MPDRDASRTALATAYLRAAHQILDARPLIFEDPTALPLLGSGASQRILGSIERYQSVKAKALRSHVVLRSRYAEDRLSAAVARGISQYIILGAGLDTFAIRQPEWAKALKIIEVDHLGTQSLKRSRIADANFEIPANVSFADVDFERESLHDGLLRYGISLEETSFFSWLGVTMYLNEAAIDETLQSMAAFPPGSEVVITFMQPPDSASDQDASLLAERVNNAGEPFVSYFKPDELREKLFKAGFTQVGFLSPEDAFSSYYDGRPADIPSPERTVIAFAIR